MRVLIVPDMERMVESGMVSIGKRERERVELSMSQDVRDDDEAFRAESDEL
jgi:hypothetical protein